MYHQKLLYAVRRINSLESNNFYGCYASGFGGGGQATMSVCVAFEWNENDVFYTDNHTN